MVSLTYIDNNIDIVYLSKSTVRTIRWHRRLGRQSTKREVVCSSSAVGENFLHFVISLSSRGLQLKLANTNEINRGIHLAYTVF